MTEVEEAPAPRRTLPIVVALLAGLLVVVAAIVLPLALQGDDDSNTGGNNGGNNGTTARDGSTVDTSNLDLVKEYDVPPWVHVREDVTYPQTPPVGGDHWDPWLECGVYTEPVPDENAVHDLEHGSVWITYRADLVDANGISELAARVPANGIMSPVPDQVAPVVITVWGRQLELVGPDDPRIALFLDEYGAGENAPEPWGSCAGGTADPAGIGPGRQRLIGATICLVDLNVDNPEREVRLSFLAG
jgi:hypothetical protein